MKKFEYKKGLGQNFLVDSRVVEKIVRAAEFKDNNLVIEIGPGSGALTKYLLKMVDRAILYEIDTRLESVLREELKDFDNYELILDDFLKRDISSDLRKYDYDNLYVVANLPYYITTPIISKIISDTDVTAMVIMVQKEVADRLSAKVGTREYGQLTVFLDYYFDIEKVMNVSKNCFIPKPKVDSAVVKLTKKNEVLELSNEDFFKRLVRDSFRFKRKTIKNNLSGYDMNKIGMVLQKYGFDVNVRSECIPYYVFVEMANELVK